MDKIVDLKKLNSATKYPSISTYHRIDGATGMLTDECVITFPEGDVYGTEKIDGVNTRLIFIGGKFLLGSREELLHASGDLVYNPAIGIVDHLRDVAEALNTAFANTAAEDPITIYGEFFGYRETGKHHRNYSDDGKKAGFRVFDVAKVHTEVLDWTPEQISSWRERGGQSFMPFDLLTRFCEHFGLEQAPLVWSCTTPEMLPGESIVEGMGLLDGILLAHKATRCALDGSPAGRPEGIVLRSRDRRAIAKLRFEDYHRTLRRKGN